MIRLIALGLLLIASPALGGTRITNGSGVTQEELTIWQQRKTSGPYRVAGDVSTNSPGSWTTINNNANLFAANPLFDNWDGNTNSTTWHQDILCTGQNQSSGGACFPWHSVGTRILHAAFATLVDPANHNHAAAVRAALLNQIARAGTDFTNTTKWCNCGVGDGNSFAIANWLTRFAFAYSYVRSNAVFSASDRNSVDTWFSNAGFYWARNVSYSMANAGINSIRESQFDSTVNVGGAYTAPVLTENGVGTATAQRTHYDCIANQPGHLPGDVHEIWNNRSATQIRFAVIASFLRDTPTSQDLQIRRWGRMFYKEWMTYAVFDDFTVNEYKRWLTNFPTTGWGYSAFVIGSLTTLADTFGRHGDTSLYEFSTSSGLVFGAGDPSNTTASAGNPKNLRKVMQRHSSFVNQRSTNSPRWIGAATATNCGNLNYLIQPVDNVSGEQRNQENYYIAGNIYFTDAAIKSAYMRTLPGSPAYPASPVGSGYVWGGEWYIYPDILFMFGQMEGLVNPFSTAPIPAPTITFTATPSAISVGQTSTLAWSTTNATSCTASGAWTGSKATSGSEIVGAIGTYTLSCTGSGGTTQQSVSIVAANPILRLPAAPSSLRLGALSAALKLAAAGGTPPVSVVTDNFNRANGGLGANWSGAYGSFATGQIVGQRVRNSAVNNSLIQTWLVLPPGVNQYAQVTLPTWNLSAPYIDAGVLLRASPPPTTTMYYVVASRGLASTTYIYKIQDGVAALLAQDASQTWAAGDIIKATAISNAISVYRNGNLFWNVTDPFALTGIYTGTASFTEGNVADVEIDDFDTGSVAGPPPPTALAAYWVDGTNGDDGNPCTKTETPQSTGAKHTIAAGIACLSAGDILNIRSGTYAEQLTIGQLSSKSGASYETATVIQSFPGEIATIQPPNGFSCMNFGNTGAVMRYIVFKDLICDGVNTPLPTPLGGIGIGGGDNGGTIEFLKFDNVEVKNFNTDGYSLGGDDRVGTDLWITGGSTHDGGMQGVTTPAGHCWYVTGERVLIENSLCYNYGGYGYHNPTVGNSTPNDGILRNSTIHHVGLVDTQSHFAVVVSGLGTNSQIYNNLIYSNQNGIDIQGSQHKIYSNTLYANGVDFVGSVGCCYDAIKHNTGSNSVIRNNLIIENQINSIDTSGSTSPTVSNNVTSGAASSFFVDAANGNFALIAGASSAIDQGLAVISSGITRAFNGSAPDIGAHETIAFSSCSATGNKITVNFQNTLNPPIIFPSVTGSTVKIDGEGSGRTLSNPVVNVNSVTMDFSGAAVTASATYEYATSGSVSDSAKIGGSANQRLNAVSAQACTVS